VISSTAGRFGDGPFWYRPDSSMAFRDITVLTGRLMSCFVLTNVINEYDDDDDDVRGAPMY